MLYGAEMLDPRADDGAIKAHAMWARLSVKNLLSDYGTHQTGPGSKIDLEHRLDAIALTMQARPVAERVSLSGRIARMLDAGWWTKNVRRQLLRENEAGEHAAGQIRRAVQVYCTDHASKAKAHRRKVNRDTLASLEVMNEAGESVNLLEVADGSVSNPKIRRGELMMRCRGFEETAEFMGHEAHFLTITAPSRFHRFSGGKSNPKWAGQTPKDAAAYLQNMWKKIRSAWNRAKFYPYGFRVVEPHHDACPHWHILIFMPKEHAGWFDPLRMVAGRKDCGAGVVGIAGRYAMQDSTSEINFRNKEARFKDVKIEPGKGSAAGYIVKYIAKNIDGETADGDSVGLDFDSGLDAKSAAKRAGDWATTWGIRQFQQIGGPSVTVWREIRRMREYLGQHGQLELFEKARAAADRAEWFAFWMLQGGPEVAKTKLALKPWAIEGEVGKYGDTAKKIIGVENKNATADDQQFLRTRMHDWVVQCQGTAKTEAAHIDQLEWMQRNKRVQEFERAGGLEVRGDVRFPLGQIENLAAWTGVNNCTPFAKSTAGKYAGTPDENDLEVEIATQELARVNRLAATFGVLRQ